MITLNIENNLQERKDGFEEDSTAALLEEYDNRKSGKADDTAAMQAAVCIMLAFMLFLLNMMSPDTAEAIFMKFAELSKDQKELFPNPVDLILSLL